MELKKLIVGAILAIVMQPPVTAQMATQAYDDPSVRFINYVQTTYGVSVGCGVQGPTDPNIATEIYFNTSSVPSATQTAIINDALNPPAAFGGWSPLPLPNILGFQLSVTQDPCIPPATLVQLSTFAGVLVSTTEETIPILQGLWAKALALGQFSGNCLDDPATTTIDESTISIVSRLETESAAYYVPFAAATAASASQRKQFNDRVKAFIKKMPQSTRLTRALLPDRELQEK